jgi:uncharacterized protein (DUF983 family)
MGALTVSYHAPQGPDHAFLAMSPLNVLTDPARTESQAMDMNPTPKDVARIMARRALRTPPALGAGLRRGLSRACPACGLGPLFRGYIVVIPTCPVCDNDNQQYPSDDFASYVTIFLVLHLLVPVLLVVDHIWDISVSLEMVVALPVFLLVTLLVLPFAKGAVIGFAWSRGVTLNPAAASAGEDSA